jgi:Transposase, Mutator family
MPIAGEPFSSSLSRVTLTLIAGSTPAAFIASKAVRNIMIGPLSSDHDDSLEEAGDRLFSFTRLPPGQWRSARTTNAIERLHEEFKRRIKTQTVLPSAETAAMLFWALLASGQISMPMAGRRSLRSPLVGQLTLQPDQITSTCWRLREANSNHIPDGTPQNNTRLWIIERCSAFDSVPFPGKPRLTEYRP